MAETCSKLHVRNSVWTAPARADRMLAVLRTNRPATTFIRDFGCRFGAKSSHVGDSCADDGTFFAAGFGVVVGVREIVGPHPEITSSQRSKSI